MLSLFNVVANPIGEHGLIHFAGCDGEHGQDAINVTRVKFETIERKK